jgi:hypothetical protein
MLLLYLTSERVKKPEPVATLSGTPPYMPLAGSLLNPGSTPMGLAGMGEVGQRTTRCSCARAKETTTMAPIPGAFFGALGCSLLPKSGAGQPVEHRDAVAWRPAMTCQIVHCAAQPTIRSGVEFAIRSPICLGVS